MALAPPRLPDAPEGYDAQFVTQLLQTLAQFFEEVTAVQPITGASLNLDITTLPTQADFANLRQGDVYVDTTAGYVLKIKP